MKMTIEISDVAVEKLMEAWNKKMLADHEGSLPWNKSDNSVRSVLANLVQALLNEQEVCELNDFGGFIEPSLEEMTDGSNKIIRFAE